MSADPARPEPADLSAVTVTTFHGLGLMILREHHDLAGLPPDVQVADEAATVAIAAELTGSAAAGRDLIKLTATDAGARTTLNAELARRGLTDFDGLIRLPAALLAAHPDIAAAWRERWPMISVDEYQDIDAAQYDLLRQLAGDGGGLTAIGDPDQAIYGFRGGDVGFFLRFGEDFPGAVTQKLGISYRSSAPIIDAALAAVAPATLVPGRPLRARADGAPVIAREAADEHAEAEWIAATIDDLLGGASFHSIDTGRARSDGHAGLSLADIAVLYRTDAQSGPIGQALTRAGLPFRKGSHDLLQRRTGVPELLAELRRATAPPGDTEPPAVADRLAAATAAVAGRLPGRLAVDIRSAAELLTPLARRCARDLEQFLTEVELGAAGDALDPRADAITLLTLHAAKGLEFDVVFLAGCEAGLLPLRFGAATDTDEERRLLFVGMTRARDRLLLSYAATRDRPGAPGGPSPFLRDIGPHRLTTPGVPAPRKPRARQLRLL
jgi:superfamily I DNA/RNA helicase